MERFTRRVAKVAQRAANDLPLCESDLRFHCQPKQNPWSPILGHCTGGEIEKWRIAKGLKTQPALHRLQRLFYSICSAFVCVSTAAQQRGFEFVLCTAFPPIGAVARCGHLGTDPCKVWKAFVSLGHCAPFSVALVVWDVPLMLPPGRAKGRTIWKVDGAQVATTAWEIRRIRMMALIWTIYDLQTIVPYRPLRFDAGTSVTNSCDTLTHALFWSHPGTLSEMRQKMIETRAIGGGRWFQILARDSENVGAGTSCNSQWVGHFRFTLRVDVCDSSIGY